MDFPFSLSDDDIAEALRKVGKVPLTEAANTYAEPCVKCGHPRSAVLWRAFTPLEFQCARCLDTAMAAAVLGLAS